MSLVDLLNTAHITYLLLLAVTVGIGRLIAFVIFFQNLKSFKASTEKFIEHSKTLEESNRLVNEDISKCVHELKTMMGNHDLRIASVEKIVFKK